MKLPILLLAFTTCFADYPNDSCKICNEGFIPSARPCIQDPCHCLPWSFFGDVSLLVWQAREDGLQFTSKNSINPSANTEVNVHAKDIYPDFPWNPAFKVMVGLGATNNWDIQVRWTSLTTHFTTNANAAIPPAGFPISLGLTPTWQQLPFAFNDLRYAFASSHWKLHFNTVDVEAGNYCLATPYLSLRLHGGVKGIFINQKYQIRYTNETSSIATDPSPISGFISLRNHVKGGGPRIGIDTHWMLGYGWYFLADASTSLILQYYRIFRKDTLTVISSTEIDSSRQVIWTWKPAAEAELGLGWGRCLGKCNTFYLAIEAGYDAQYFAEQNQFPIFVDPLVTHRSIPAKGDLILHGLNLRFNLEF